LGAIGRSRRVFSIGGEFPLDVIFGVLIKVYLIDQSPKFDNGEYIKLAEDLRVGILK
jgi:hypothetical protein